MKQRTLFDVVGEGQDFRDANIASLRQRVQKCTKCPNHRVRKNALVGRGSLHPKVIFVGEAPTQLDDTDGRVFSGHQENVLDWMIDLAGLTWDEVFVTNVLCCRPLYNRVPEYDELKSCLPHVKEVIHVLDPLVIVAMGGTAAKGLLKINQPFGSMRGDWFRFERRIPVRVTFHPVKVRKAPGARSLVAEDMEYVRRRVEIREQSRGVP